MITYKNEYINLVVLGSFNPAILSHDFLVKQCGFDLGQEPRSKTPPMPVVAALEYEKISFFADLGRLQITERDCKNPKSSLLPRYLDTYLKKLPYTPVTKCGANFRDELNVAKSRLELVGEWLKENRSKFCEILQCQAVDLEMNLTIDSDKEKIKSWVLRTKVKEYNASTMIKISTITGCGDKVKVDFNYEVGNLDKDKNLIKSITGDYVKVVDLFRNQVEKIFG